ncbi:MAG: hypothetical protein D6698_02085 [Gammaproteobacteria bacterium]|nr:MAG: hypothetical protein D6698_02085 [Gammaproteobacteria bacterium]
MHTEALQMLYDEHQVILQKVHRLRQLLQNEDLSTKQVALKQYITFFRTYGDAFHHQKEEDLLFSFLRLTQPGLLPIVEALEEHHEMFREYLSDIEDAVDESDWEKVRSLFEKYLSNLEDHISAEDDELFVSVEMVLSPVEKERLFFAFQDKDEELGSHLKLQYEQAEIA